MEIATQTTGKNHALIQNLRVKHGGKLILEESIISPALKSQTGVIVAQRDFATSMF